MSELPPAGWYDDPEQATGLRYWDGATWTDHRHVPEGAVPADTPGPADEAPAATEPAIDREPAVDRDAGTGLGTDGATQQEPSRTDDPAPFARPDAAAPAADPEAVTGWAHPDGGAPTTPAPPSPPLPDQGGARQQPAPPRQTSAAWQQEPQWRARPDRVSGKAAASLVLSLAWLFGVGSVVAVVLGVLGRRDVAADPDVGGSGMATAGIVLGVLGALFALLVLTALV